MPALLVSRTSETSIATSREQPGANPNAGGTTHGKGVPFQFVDEKPSISRCAALAAPSRTTNSTVAPGIGAP